ncbi:hypothetical protein SRABI128_03625 [Microbacterium sp. Bi128]|nr:hypothetical protein SRABI128_03625 [Microbacterium sp. Bi128]
MSASGSVRTGSTRPGAFVWLHRCSPAITARSRSSTWRSRIGSWVFTCTVITCEARRWAVRTSCTPASTRRAIASSSPRCSGVIRRAKGCVSTACSWSVRSSMCSGSPIRRSAPWNARPSGVACMTWRPRSRYSRSTSPVGRASRRSSATTSRCIAAIDSATREKSAGSSRARWMTFSASSSKCSSSGGSTTPPSSAAISASRAARSARRTSRRRSGSVSASRARRSTASSSVRTRERETRARPPPARPAISSAPTACAERRYTSTSSSICRLSQPTRTQPRQMSRAEPAGMRRSSSVSYPAARSSSIASATSTWASATATAGRSGENTVESTATTNGANLPCSRSSIGFLNAVTERR